MLPAGLRAMAKPLGEDWTPLWMALILQRLRFKKKVNHNVDIYAFQSSFLNY
jgi:hypothetical protein